MDMIHVWGSEVQMVPLHARLHCIFYAKGQGVLASNSELQSEGKFIVQDAI